MKLTRSGVHVALLVAVLLAYGSYALNVAVDHNSLFQGLGAIVALAAALGAALNRRWSLPLVWILAGLLILEWAVSTASAYRGGYFASIPLLSSIIAMVPGIGLCVLSGYCCYVVKTYIGER